MAKRINRTSPQAQLRLRQSRTMRVIVKARDRVERCCRHRRQSTSTSAVCDQISDITPGAVARVVEAELWLRRRGDRQTTRRAYDIRRRCSPDLWRRRPASLQRCLTIRERPAITPRHASLDIGSPRSAGDRLRWKWAGAAGNSGQDELPNSTASPIVEFRRKVRGLCRPCRSPNGRRRRKTVSGG